MAQLAIEGHKTRGEEVIEILGILGGSNAFGHIGNNPRAIYYIDETYKNFIICSETKKVHDGIIFTLEEFLEKFPYKVGDRVRVPEYESEIRIDDMKWDGNKVQYEVFTDMTEWYSAEELNLFNAPYKEQTTEKNKIFNEVLDTLSSYLIDFMTPQGIDKCIKYIRDNMDEYSKEETTEEIKVDIPKGYEFAGVDDDRQQVVFTKIQLRYPKTYKECIGQLPINWDGKVEGYKCELLLAFQKLLIARDVYWKIAGEQMGLGKPWEPDFTNDNEERYGIYTTANKVVKDFCGVGDVNVILTFPTEEMRDAFYENFKELIEQCKKLL